MRATVVRFGPELFEEMQAEAAQCGVSVAQFVREAVVARMAYVAGRRDDDAYRLAARQAAIRVRAEWAESAQAPGRAGAVVRRVK
ncbi:MAG TPA: hypothetical protein VGJ32_05660 [Solirubrobacteraceae bacterium]|jgi:class 3 adenylate cyclase